jgi:hypothetical protein
MELLERVRLGALAAAAALATMLVLVLVTARFAGRSTAGDVIQFSALVLCVNLLIPKLRAVTGRARWGYIALFGVAFGVVSELARLALLHWV